MLSVKKLLYKMLSFLYGDSDWTRLNPMITYRKRGGFVQVNVYGTVNVTAAWQTLGTLPLGYRPSTSFYFAGTTVSANASVIMDAEPDGRILVRGYGSASLSVEASVTYIAA